MDHLRGPGDLAIAVAVLLLGLLVRRYHRPWPATVVLTGLLVFLEVRALRPPAGVLLHIIVYGALAGGLFWAVDRSPSPLITGGLLAAGAAVLAYLV